MKNIRKKIVTVTTSMVPGMLLACSVLALAAPAVAQTTPAASAALAVPAASAQKLRIVGGLTGLNQYTQHEEPFWTKELPRLSQGKFGAEIVPFDRAGVPGQDMLRLIQMGVVPFGTAQISRVAAQDAEFSAPDLAGLNPDIGALKKTVAAFRPYLEATLRQRYRIELLGIYAYPAQVLFCKKPVVRLADLAGRRIRVSGTSAADFVESFGGIPVLTGMSDIMLNMSTNNIECAITGTMSGNTLGLHDVTTHVHAMAITWGLSIFGANTDSWGALPSELRALLRQELPRLEARIWEAADRETIEGLACNTGAASCVKGRKGRMTEVRVTPEDERRRREVLATRILPRWLQRCGPACSDVWNKTIGPVSGVVATVAPTAK
jgi:TRAP-type C4-dicarboxylate transport system substrate-binding protein